MQETVAGRDISEIEGQYRRFWVEQDNITQNYIDLFWESGKPPVPTISHSITEPLGKVVNVHKTENGLEVTVEHSDDERLPSGGYRKYISTGYIDYDENGEAIIEHHGILGQKWGVRRYQNKDGTRTAEGKRLEHYRRRTIRELKNVDDVNKIVASLPREEQLALGVGREDKAWIPEDRRAEISSNIAKTFIEYDGDEPVSMLEIWDIGDGKADIALATNPKYRGTGVTSKNIKAAVDWFNSGNNKEFDQLQWNNLKMNPKSGQIAEHYGFGDYDEDDKWEYRRIFKDKPIKHSDTEDSDEGLYGIPEIKKYPMPDKKHVKSAIRFFNYVDPKYEKELAEAIIEKAEEFGLDLENDISVGDENRFQKYLKKEDADGN
jgi:RimJ/RimL family protein N-acetyltransferase